MGFSLALGCSGCGHWFGSLACVGGAALREVPAVPLLDSTAGAYWWCSGGSSSAFVQAASVNELPIGVRGAARS